MAADDLEWLGTWYQQQCNGKWEHQKGMLLEALSGEPQPGWRLRIDLRGTAAAGSPSRHLAVCAFKGAWLRCNLNQQQFEGEGEEVEELIAVFRRWIDSQPPILEAASAG